MGLFSLPRRQERPVWIVVLLCVGCAVYIWSEPRTYSSEPGQEPRRERAAPLESNSPFVQIQHTWTMTGVGPGRLHGQYGLRPDGKPGWQSLPPLDQTTETVEDKQKHHEPNGFNLRRSDGISLSREVPDVRDPQCRDIQYPNDLPNTSVVFVFFNEPLSPLFRSIHSVLDRTPRHLLHEIILVDDGSDAPWLQQPLEDYLALLPPKVKLIRAPVRLGLMSTRERGAAAATGQTVTFLDAHIECNEGWLEPMLARVKEDPRHVVMPIIDSIDPDTWEYREGGLDILGFSWILGQKGIGTRKREKVKPMESPIMAGGLFTIDRKLFFDLGGYDDEMRLYGGEEMELSFRIWQCHNTLECIPCSHVGHVFRTGAYYSKQVYPVPSEVIVKNKLRAAEVWMDGFKDIAKSVMSRLPEGVGLGPLDKMLEIRQRLKCKSFQWYLKEVYPELFVPNDPGMVLHRGEVRNAAIDGCLDTLGGRNPGTKCGVYPCHHNHGTQEFLFTSTDEFRVAVLDFDSCLDSANVGEALIYPCHRGRGNQEWKYNEDTGQITQNTQCLTASHVQSGQSPFTLSVEPCKADDLRQKWEFNH